MVASRPSKASVLDIEGTAVVLTRRQTTRLSVRVDNLTGQVRVGAPHRLSEAQIRAFIIEKLDWIRQQQYEIAGWRARAPQSRWEYGQVAFLFGAMRRLYPWEPGRRNLGAGVSELAWDWQGEAVFIATLEGGDKRPAKVLDALLNTVVQERIAYHYPTVKRRPSQVRCRQMRSRWGSCSSRTGIITLNRQLVHLPVRLIDYVVVHELTHLWESGHQLGFQRRMDQYLPNWRHLRAELNDPRWMHIS